MPVDLNAIDLTRFGPDTFRSASALRQAGFALLRESDDKTKIMVARHPDLDGILIKTFPHQIASDVQHANYKRRVEGARRIQQLIDEQHFTHLITAKKRCYKFPSHQRVLCVEALPILTETKERYQTIDEATLRELVFVLAAFPGLDSATHNLPFLPDGRIAFIDTEDWQQRDWRRVTGLKYVLPLLSSERRHLAEKLWRRHFPQFQNKGENIIMRTRRRS
jgi:hypothetical protein